MIFFRGILFLAFALMGAAPVAAQDSMCEKIKLRPSVVNINLEAPDPHYDLDKSLAYLNSDGGKSAEEWLNKNKMQNVWSSKHMVTKGRAAGGWAAYYNYKMGAEALDSYWAYGCLFIEEINIEMMFRTIIMIPVEYPQGSCEFNFINEHELKHFDANKYVALKTTERLRQDMPEIIRVLEQAHVGSDKLNLRAEEIKAGIQEMVDIYFKQVMAEEMELLNDKIDTPEEYARTGEVMSYCRDQENAAARMPKRKATDGKVRRPSPFSRN